MLSLVASAGVGDMIKKKLSFWKKKLSFSG